VALKWRASSDLQFVPAPEGFSPEGGWWTAVSGVVSALSTRGRDFGRVPTVPNGTHDVESAFDGEWHKGLSQTQLGKETTVKSIVLPAWVTAMGEWALAGFAWLESVLFPVGCTIIGERAFYNCVGLRAVALPADCRSEPTLSAGAVHSSAW
jgi:hypothetical protein